MSPSLDEVLRLARGPDSRERLAGFLLDILRIDTTVGPDLDRVRAGEERAFARIAEAVALARGSAEGLARVPIDPRIEADPYYTAAHYTATADRPDGLPAAAAYEGRSNLVARVPGQGRGTLALNAHIDVVAPYVAPRLDGGIVYGRGACDDKGQCAAMVLALELVERARRQCGIEPAAGLLLEFVIDEEPGGNGSLSLALDRRFAADAMVVLEATDLRVHPGNRGAVWYHMEFDGSAAAPGLDMVGLAATAVLGLEEEGAAIKAESDHPLFPHRPVQTCHGILGPWGEHPSAVNDRVELGVAFGREPGPQRLVATIDRAVAAYCAVYGDKTHEADPATGKPKVHHHYDLAVEGDVARLVVHGKAGHMGAAAQCDNAITKAAYIIRALESDDSLAIMGFSLDPERPREPSMRFALQGGQGFLPTHSLVEVMERMVRAVTRVGEPYARQHGHSPEVAVTSMCFDKLHNDAFARDPESPAVRAFVAAARAAGIEVAEPLRGWDVSCDARIFAREYPDSAIVTFGAGKLAHAHSADEQVRLDDVARAAEAIARFALAYDPSTAGERTQR